MESYEDILETVRGVAAEHDPMFSQRGADAVGITDRIQRRILDYRSSNAFEGMSPAQRDAIHTKNIEVNGRLLEDARRYELAETFKWAKSECERRTGRNLGELASAFGRRIDLVGSENRDKDGNIIRRIASLTDENGKTVEVDKTREFLEAQIEPIVDEFAAESKRAFKAAYDAYKGLGVGDADAEAAAMKSCHDYVVGSLQGYAEGGDEIRGMFVDSVLGKFGNADARLVGPYGKRNDGKTYKGSGWLGEIPVKGGGVATEYTVGVQIDGKEIDIPTLVPTLTKDEVSQMVNDIIPNSKPVPDAIMEKAAAHAKKRLSEGKSVFANDGEAVFDPAGGLWMDDNDVAKLSDITYQAKLARERATRAAEQMARANKKAEEDALKSEAVSLRAMGDSLIPRDSSRINDKDIGVVLDRLTKIGMLGVPEANSAYEHIVSAVAEHNKMIAEVDATKRSEDELERMWDEFDYSQKTSTMGQSFGADLAGVQIDSKKKMILEIERAYTNGTIKDDPKSDSSVWGRRLRDLKSKHYDDNLLEMAQAMKKAGISVDRKGAAKLSGNNPGIGDIVSSWGGVTPSIDSVLSIDENGVISTKAQAIPFIWDDGTTKWKISGAAMRSILDELSRNWQAEKLDPSAERLQGIISRVMKQSRRTETSWLLFSNEYIDPQSSIETVQEITSQDLQNGITYTGLKAKTTSRRR